MDKLLEMATPEAYEALLGRFTFNANGQIADEDEKRDLVDQFVELGATVVGPLKTFIGREKAISFPIRALVRIVGRDEALPFLIECLSAHEPSDHRSFQAKTSLIIAITDLAGPECAEVIAPYLSDHSDDVQFQAVVALEALANPDSAKALANVCVEEAHAGRIQRRAAEALASLKFSVKEEFERFQPEIKEEYILGKKGVLAKKYA